MIHLTSLQLDSISSIGKRTLLFGNQNLQILSEIGDDDAGTSRALEVEGPPSYWMTEIDDGKNHLSIEFRLERDS